MSYLNLFKLFALVLALMLMPFTAQASIDEAINNAVAPVANAVSSVIFFSVPVGEAQLPLIVLWLIIAATVFTLYFGFIQFRVVGQAIRLIRGVYDDPKHAGEVSHFQALATAVSGTVGLGNIAGVAVAVAIGGPGATFWMILAGLLGMASKFTECTLGVKYRNEYPDGSVSGGPMYYLSKGLALQNKAALGKFLAVFFAIACIFGSFGGGNMFQANQAFQQVVIVTGGASSFMADKGWLFGLILAVLTGAVIVGGIKSIARVTEKLVPFMAIWYLVACLIIILMNFDKIGWAFSQIFEGAFTGAGATGGVIGALIQGFKRAAFSNEAGVGSASIAHSAVRTTEPATEGIVSTLEPFIDTVVICTMTALVIVITGSLTSGAGLTGVELTSHAFGSAFSWFPYLLSVAVLLFAFSTMISWSYYGLKAWTYLVGEGKTQELIFKFVFLVFIVIGSSMSLGPVIDFSDAMIFAMSIANIIGLYMLMPVVKREVNQYLAKIKSGEIKRVR
ncbi:alanine or glycine:cation symporter, AGCS family [Thiothrix eikelboomii]|uniref:Alanine or glycine:cation symporter, AGCS family n=1 Tax=Thiothrix eikelboomii TaxID=92487 RepID=A0A1T4XSD9_9GAMM|nr:alanine/glycine:cation symporter family protein [Thiothrix eikelboomii]SKA91975.1 alanine or glycine:cation symporter, AGCS family [Thiothrix eikelboomii]